MEDQVKAEQVEQAEQVEPKLTVKTLQVEFDLTKLWMADIPLINDIATGKPYLFVDAINMLGRVMVGGLGERELTQYRPLLSRLVAVMNDIINPKLEG